MGHSIFAMAAIAQIARRAAPRSGTQFRHMSMGSGQMNVKPVNGMENDTVLDLTSRVMFMTEMCRGLTKTFETLLEPKLTLNYPYEKNALSPRFVVTQQARSAASHASFAKQSAQHKQSPSRPSHVQMTVVVPPDTTLT